MRYVLPILGLFLYFFAFTAPAEARSNAARHGTTLRGEIIAIDATAETFTLMTLGGHEVKVHTHDETRYRVDGNPATFADLAVGQKAVTRGKFVHGPNGKKGFAAFRVRAKS